MTPSRTFATSSQRSVASSRKSSASFHFMTTIGSRSSSNSLVTACWWMRSASFSRRLISIAGAASPLLCSSAVSAEMHLLGAGADDPRQLARAEAHRLEPIEPHQRRRRVDRVHHIVERARQRVNVLAVERRDEGAVEALDDLVRQEVALVLDLLDLVGLVPDRAVRREASPRAAAPPCFSSVGERLEIGIELLFARNQSERHRPGKCSRSVYTVVTRASHGPDASRIC